jgi:glutathione S-transferase
MKLFYSPGACSLGIHVILEETGASFEPVLTSVRDGSNRKPEFLALNPKAKVPTLLRDSGAVLTEYPAIAVYLARTNPRANLLPANPEDEAEALEAMDYIVATVHMQGFTRIARPANFTPNEADIEAVKARGREIYAAGMDLLEARMQGREFVAGTAFSIADATLLYVENWAARADYTLKPNLAAHLARMKARPSVQRAFASEGLTT